MEQAQIIEFKEFLEKTKGLSAKTITDYSYWIKDFDLSQLSQDYIDKYIQDRDNNSGVRAMMLNLIEYTGTKKLFDLPPKITGRTKKRIVRDISKDEISILREFLYEISFRKGLMFDLMYQGALRRIEVTSIKLNSFKWFEWIEHPDQSCQLLVIGKGNKERVVLINPETMNKIFSYYNTKFNFKDINELRNFLNSQSLLFTIEGKQISMHYVWKVIHDGSKNILNRDIRPHELRHCRATELERMGVPIKDIQNYLGHTSIATTEIYLHTSEKESIDNIQKIMKGELTK